MGILNFRRQLGGTNLALYAGGEIGEDSVRLPFSGKLRKSRKVHNADCGHRIHIGEQYLDARSSSLPGTAVRYCKKCLREAENAPWDFEDDIKEHEEILDGLTDSSF